MASKDKDTGILIIIIILLLVFLPASIYGTIIYVQNKEISVKDEEGVIKFVKDNNLIGTYTCISKTCRKAKSINDEKKIYEDKTNDKEDLGIINYNNLSLAFVEDNEKVLLINVTTSKTVSEFEEIKYYNTEIENNLILLKKDGKWGLFSLDSLGFVVKNEYDYLGLVANRENNYLKADQIIAYKNNKYYLINQKGEKISEEFVNPIYNFNDTYIATISSKISIYDYQKIPYLTNLDIKDFIWIDNYNVIVDNLGVLYLYQSLNNNYLESFTVNEYSYLKLETTNKKLNVYLDNNLFKTLAI